MRGPLALPPLGSIGERMGHKLIQAVRGFQHRAGRAKCAGRHKQVPLSQRDWMVVFADVDLERCTMFDRHVEPIVIHNLAKTIERLGAQTTSDVTSARQFGKPSDPEAGRCALSVRQRAPGGEGSGICPPCDLRSGTRQIWRPFPARYRCTMPEGPARDATSNEEYQTPSNLGRRPSGPNCLTPNSGRTVTRRRFGPAEPPGRQSHPSSPGKSPLETLGPGENHHVRGRV